MTLEISKLDLGRLPDRFSWRSPEEHHLEQEGASCSTTQVYILALWLKRSWMWLLLPGVLQCIYCHWPREGCDLDLKVGILLLLLLLLLLYQKIHSVLTWKARASKRVRETSPSQGAKNRSSYTITTCNITRFKTYLLSWQEIRYQIVVSTCIPCTVIILIIEIFWDAFRSKLDIPGWRLHRERLNCDDDFSNNDFLW